MSATSDLTNVSYLWSHKCQLPLISQMSATSDLTNVSYLWSHKKNISDSHVNCQLPLISQEKYIWFKCQMSATSDLTRKIYLIHMSNVSYLWSHKKNISDSHVKCQLPLISQEKYIWFTCQMSATSDLTRKIYLIHISIVYFITNSTTT
jgi:hypothetical protein